MRAKGFRSNALQRFIRSLFIFYFNLNYRPVEKKRKVSVSWP